MAKTLELRFLNSEGKAKSLSIQNPVNDLDAETVQTAMNQLVQQNIFEKEGIQFYSTVKGARYVERIATDIFESAE